MLLGFDLVFICILLGFFFYFRHLIFCFRMDERVVLRFQWKEVIQDLIVYDKDRETLLDLILDWEAECVKAGKEMPLQPRFYYMYNNEVQWLDWDDDLFKMFSKFPMEEMIVVYVMEVEVETKLMNSVRSLKKLQHPD